MSDYINNLSYVVKQANNWLENSALPLWFRKGVDWKRGGFHESLDMDDLICSSEFKRVRVLARQIYVFSVACKFNKAYYLPAVIHGLDFLLTKARISTGGYASHMTLLGDKLPAHLDLYDQAFCLFALAHGYKLLGETRLRDEAIFLTSFIINHFRHLSGGFSESLPSSLPRRQNPHMHFLEALLEWRLISDDLIFRDTSDEIVTLFFNKFFFSESGALIEYFNDDLTPVTGRQGELTEPGHHFEWLWLLTRYIKISGISTPDYTKLYEFAHLHGVNRDNGFLWGEVTSTGLSVGAQVRLWPHTEWLKAELIKDDVSFESERACQAWSVMKRFLDCPQPGLWHESYDHKKNIFLNGPSPASSLYHIVLAIEVLNERFLIKNSSS